MTNSCLRINLCLLVTIILLCDCRSENIATTIEPDEFKVVAPFDVNRRGIIIKTYWVKSKQEHLLYWDNNSPTTASESTITDNLSVTKSNTYKYRTTTSDGTSIHGDVYICDEIEFGNALLGNKVLFRNVPMYGITTRRQNAVQDTVSGSFGIDMIAKGIWKIDFKNYIFTFVSNINSLQNDVLEADVIPAIFKNSSIEIPIQLSNNTLKYFQVDLGFNGCLIVPSRVFKRNIPENKIFDYDSLLFSSATSSNITLHTTAKDTISIGKKQYHVVISTNAAIKENLIGLQFFNRYQFVIFDYLKNVIYVSKKHNY